MPHIECHNTHSKLRMLGSEDILPGPHKHEGCLKVKTGGPMVLDLE